VDIRQRMPGHLKEMALLSAMLRFGIILIRPKNMAELVLVDEHGANQSSKKKAFPARLSFQIFSFNYSAPYEVNESSFYSQVFERFG
jgi:hypothetical protein